MTRPAGNQVDERCRSQARAMRAAIERARREGGHWGFAHNSAYASMTAGLLDEAAAEVARLRAANEALAGALRGYLAYEQETKWQPHPKSPCGCPRCVAARAALAAHAAGAKGEVGVIVTDDDGEAN